MAEVPSLPEELLQAIFSNLEPSGPSDYRANRRTLVSVCLASEQCHRLAQPILFSNIHIQEGTGVIGKVLKAIIHKPRLATLISVLHVESWGGIEGGNEPIPGDVTTVRQDQLPSLEDVHPVLGDIAEQLLADVENGLEDTSLALLLVLCQKLTNLELTMPYGYESSWVCKLLRHVARTNPGALSDLNELFVEHWDTEGACDANKVSHIVAVPSLRVFRAHMLDFGQNGLTDRYPTVPANALREIHLTYALIGADGVKNLLLSSPCIEKLSIEWGDSCVGPLAFRYDEVGDALRECYRRGKLDNLRSLTLDERSAQNDAREELDGEEFPGLGDLRYLSALQVLDVPQAALVGVDLSLDADTDESQYQMSNLIEILPRSLTRLRVNSFDSEGLADFHEQLLAVAVSDRFDYLVEVTVVRTPTSSKKKDLKAAGWRVSKRAILQSEDVVLTFARASRDRLSII